jgi:hypothetical protein
MAEDARATEPMPLGAKLWVAGVCVMLLLAGGGHSERILPRDR